MAKQYAHDLDLLGVFQLLRARVQNLASDPSGLAAGDAGRIWFNTTAGVFKYWTGTTAINPLDRANHTGTQLAATISNLAATVQAYPLSSFAPPTGPVALNGQKLTGGADATANTDIPTYQQLLAVQAIAAGAASGVAYKSAVRAVATANITLTGTQTVDGVALAVADRVLVAGQTDATQNGIYVVASGAWTRAADADTTGELAPGTQVAVTSGAVAASSGGNADSLWRIVSDATITIGTTAQTWEKLPGTAAPTYIGGAGLTLTGSTFDVGAGDGILVDPDAVRVNPNRVRRKRTGIVPNASTTVTCDDGTTMTVTVTGGTVAFAHGLGNPTADIRCTYHTSPGSGNTQGQPILPDYTNAADGNTTTAVFPAVPGTNQYRFDIDG